MTIHVTVETCQGVVEEVRAFLSEESAAAEQEWLQEAGITDKRTQDLILLSA